MFGFFGSDGVSDGVMFFVGKFFKMCMLKLKQPKPVVEQHSKHFITLRQWNSCRLSTNRRGPENKLFWSLFDIQKTIDRLHSLLIEQTTSPVSTKL